MGLRIVRADHRDCFWLLLGEITAAMVAVLACLPQGEAFAASSQAMGPDSVISISDPGTSLGVPPDGRLRGYQFAGQVLGVATGTKLGQGTSAVVATRGQRLWVFGLRLTDGTDDGGSPDPVMATMVVDGTRIQVPLPDSYRNGGNPHSTFDTGPMYWVASVPAAASDVAIELAAAGLAQTFSFTKMAREGTQPAVLYRGSNSWQLTQPLSGEHDLATPDPDGYTTNAVLPVKLTGVTLSWFGPDTTSDVPSSPDQAWLLPSLSSLNYDNPGNGMCFPSLPSSDITLTIPGAPPIPTTVFPGLGTDRPRLGAFTNSYGFKVPASITTATLTIAPGTFQAMTQNCAIQVTVTAQGSAVFPLDLPAATTTPPPESAVRIPPPIHTLAGQAGSPRSAAGSSFPLLAVVLPVALVILAGLTTARSIVARRRRAAPGRTPVPARTTDAGPPTPRTEILTATPAGADTAARHSSERPADVGVPASQTPPAHGAQPSASRVLLIPPPGPAPLDDGIVEVQVLGSPRVIGWPPDAPPPGATLLELLAFLALRPGERFGADQLRSVLGRGREREVDPATVRRYVGELRRSLGERIPESRPGSGYEAANVSTDARRLIESVSTARSTDDPEAKARHLSAGLSLVRGYPFSDSPPGTYGWAHTDTNPSALLANTILSATLDLADLAIGAGDPDIAAWAVDKGLLVWPTEEALHERALAAANIASPSKLTQAWAQVNARLAAEQESPSPRLIDYWQQLRNRT